jgi:hypothetical protein
MHNKNVRHVEIDPDVYRELEYMAGLFSKHGSAATVRSVSELVAYVLSSVADGSRRPGSWESQLLTMMGLVANSPEHHAYRATYGRPDEEFIPRGQP